MSRSAGEIMRDPEGRVGTTLELDLASSTPNAHVAGIWICMGVKRWNLASCNAMQKQYMS